MSMADFIGKVAFIVGILFAFFGGIWGGENVPTNDFVIVMLLICGILIGLLNITTREAPTVLIATIALVLVSLWIDVTGYHSLYDFSAAIWENTTGVVTSLAILMVPAAVIISIKAVLATANRD